MTKFKTPSRSTLSDLCSAYSIGPILDINSSTAGTENLNYFIRAGKESTPQEYVLSIIQTPSYSGDFYFSMMTEIEKRGLPVPVPIKDRDGKSFQWLDDKKVILQQRLLGSHVIEPTNKNLVALIQMVARIQQIPIGVLGTLPKYPRDAGWLTQQIQLISGLLDSSQIDLIDQALIRLTNIKTQDTGLDLCRGLIHADLFRDNVLFDSQTITGILDFHHAAIGYRMYDLAVIAIDWSQDRDGALYKEFIGKILQTYDAITPINADEIEHFESFIILATLNFWISRLVSLTNNGNRSKEPAEMEKRLRSLI